MFTGIFLSIMMMAVVVYTSVLVSSYFAERANKRIDKMTSRLDELDSHSLTHKTEENDV